MRTTNALRNILTSWVGQIVIFFCNLFSRWIFLQVLSLDYLGINGLFANILTLLSFADLGLGASIAYYLYEPLANKDYVKINQIIQCYKKIYSTIGICVVVIGCMLIPFLPAIVGENKIENLTLIYIMHICNTGISYFNVHKRTLLSSDQKGYIITTYTNVVKLIQVILAAGVLFVSKSYIAYYSVQIVATIITNYLISNKADNMYPFLKDSSLCADKGDIWNRIVNNIGAMSIHKVAEVVVNGTDNILVSVFVNVAAVGLYSNYLTIINCVGTIVSSVFSSMSAGIGDYSVSENAMKKEQLFKSLIFIEFWIYGFCSICLYVLLTPFVEIWLGNEYDLDKCIVFVVVLNFYIQGMRRIVLSFRNAEGLWQQDKYKAVLEAVINLIVSLVLARQHGMIGVFVGTTVSLVLTCVWLEPLILYKYAFHLPVRKYFVEYIKYFIEVMMAGCVTYFLCKLLSIESSVVTFVVKCAICAVVPNIIFLVFNIRSPYLKQLVMRLKTYIPKYKH